jgi:hypothetical protein
MLIENKKIGIIPNLFLPKVIIAILKPIPGSPKRFSLGTLQSSKIKLQVEEARIPILSSFLPSERPEKSELEHVLNMK